MFLTSLQDFFAQLKNCLRSFGVFVSYHSALLFDIESAALGIYSLK
jgi:hypothetical protein